ncbi:hypothetical protein HY045_00195 [Candidatus Woesebacteria bacterium]|nr:hypothetical protein [Candidatus Woesebacteria bacterium]
MNRLITALILFILLVVVYIFIPVCRSGEEMWIYGRVYYDLRPKLARGETNCLEKYQGGISIKRIMFGDKA